MVIYDLALVLLREKILSKKFTVGTEKRRLIGTGTESGIPQIHINVCSNTILYIFECRAQPFTDLSMKASHHSDGDPD